MRKSLQPVSCIDFCAMIISLQQVNSKFPPFQSLFARYKGGSGLSSAVVFTTNPGNLYIHPRDKLQRQSRMRTLYT